MAINNTSKTENKKSQATITIINGTVVTPAIIPETDTRPQESVVEQIVVEPSAVTTPPEVATELELSNEITPEQVEKMQEYLMQSLEAGMASVDLVEVEKQFRRDMAKFLNEYGVDGDLDGAISAMIGYLDAEEDARTEIKVYETEDRVFTEEEFIAYMEDPEQPIKIFPREIAGSIFMYRERVRDAAVPTLHPFNAMNLKEDGLYYRHKALVAAGFTIEENPYSRIRDWYEPSKPKKPGFFSRWFGKEEPTEQAA